MREVEKKRPTVGVSIPETKPFSQVTFCWVPSSGIPTITGTSTINWVLVLQNPNRMPSEYQKIKQASSAVSAMPQMRYSYLFKLEDGLFRVFV